MVTGTEIGIGELNSKLDHDSFCLFLINAREKGMNPLIFPAIDK